MNSRVMMLIFLFGVIVLRAQDSIPDNADADIQLKTYLEKDEVPQNGEVVYRVELIWHGELNRYQISNVGDPVVSNLKLRGSGSSNRYFVDDSGNPKSVKQVNFYFTPIEMGMAYIDGITIQYEDNTTAQKETLFAQRLGVKIIEPLDDPNADLDYGLIVIIAIVILFFLIVIYYVARYIKQRKLIAKADQVQQITLEEKYMELLDNIELSAENRNETLSSITKLLNSYFSEKFDLSGAPEFNRIKNELEKQGVDTELRDKINNLYERDKLSKFALEQVAENELHLFFDSVEQLINSIQEKETEHNDKI